MRAVLCLVVICIPGLFSTAIKAADPADAIYHGGDVITIDDKNPTAEAVAIKGGKIVAVGTKADVLKLKGDNTNLIDLSGKTLLPGFVDGHGHCLYVGVQAASANLLAPPDHTVKNIGDLQAELKKWAAGDTAKKFKLILGFGYDDAQLKERRHPTRHELDEVSKDLPVLIIHQSSHLATMNTKALELAGITAETKNPPGGVIRREADGKTPDGTLEETAFMVAAVKVLPKIGEAELDALGLAGQRLYAANGFTFAQEGRSNAMLDKTWMRLAEAKKMLIDVASYPDLTFSDTPFGMDTPWYSKTLKNGYRIAG